MRMRRGTSAILNKLQLTRIWDIGNEEKRVTNLVQGRSVQGAGGCQGRLKEVKNPFPIIMMSFYQEWSLR
jgi:hypothetical protein